jgi:hypothetical protein
MEYPSECRSSLIFFERILGLGFTKKIPMNVTVIIEELTKV